VDPIIELLFLKLDVWLRIMSGKVPLAKAQNSSKVKTESKPVYPLGTEVSWYWKVWLTE
jgi:hypothetical protein